MARSIIILIKMRNCRQNAKLHTCDGRGNHETEKRIFKDGVRYAYKQLFLSARISTKCIRSAAFTGAAY